MNSTAGMYRILFCFLHFDLMFAAFAATKHSNNKTLTNKDITSQYINTQKRYTVKTE